MKMTREILSRCQNYTKWQWTSITVVVFAVWLYMLPSPIDPKPYTYPTPLPRLEGPLKKNFYLQYAERLFEGKIKGPESFAVDDNGTIYTGGADGRLFAIRNRNLTLIGRTGIAHSQCGTFEYEPACGRPKGMKVGPDGYLYIVDAYKGLLKMDLKDYKIETLIESQKGIDGVPFMFLNGLDISKAGIVYFTDSSTKWDRRNHKYEVLETHQEGRVFAYNIYTRKAEALLTGLYLANGIALSMDETFLIISEMSVARIRRLYIKGSLKGSSDIFVDNLPGYPDNIKKNVKGHFYIGMASVRFEGASPLGSFLDIVGPYPSAKRFIAKITPFFVYNVFLPRHAMIIELNHNGQIVGSLQDPGALKIGAASEAFEYKNNIYIGHFESPYLGILDSTLI